MLVVVCMQKEKRSVDVGGGVCRKVLMVVVCAERC